MPSRETYERLVSLRKAGAIADKVNLSASCVQNLCNEQDLKQPSRLTGRDVEDMVRMRNDGSSIQSIAEHCPG